MFLFLLCLCGGCLVLIDCILHYYSLHSCSKIEFWSKYWDIQMLISGEQIGPCASTLKDVIVVVALRTFFEPGLHTASCGPRLSKEARPFRLHPASFAWKKLGHASGNSHILVPQNSVVLQQLGERWGGLSSPAFIQRILIYIYIYIYVLIKSS